ncbi:MarR family transcriptional regulator [Bosea caraganae]|uniref:MarR family transcriptional regulator n=1 Tax=Bosea caraganae TaxID=2763117 RepID=A0A370L2E5_9HYPH|nr:MarR family transcriptional regulator [Bosea caraganae]RDJ22274.1 MarR family transcriptional regulator [Bosea caraganae]RDJ22818.1 MarR family transcriptional regulator [Bosea caraganae]
MTGPLACHCFATRQLARHVTKLYERHLAPSGLTGTQLSILSFLHQTPGLAMSELSHIMVMDRTTLLRAIKPLERDGLVASARKPGDSRQFAFSVSPAGLSKIERTLPLWQAAQQEYETLVGAERAAGLRRDFHELTSSPT